ncbi:hypothetical protein C0V97_09675, partial [Asaia sp. W19]
KGGGYGGGGGGDIVMPFERPRAGITGRYDGDVTLSEAVQRHPFFWNQALRAVRLFHWARARTRWMWRERGVVMEAGGTKRLRIAEKTER